MRKLLLFTIAVWPLLGMSQTVIISDDFESYDSGDLIGATSPIWTTWSGGTADDAPISDDQAHSGDNSLYIVGNNGPSDIILPFPSDFTSGTYELTLWIYIVAGKGAYYNFQQSSVPGVGWMFEILYDNAGGGEINAGGTSAASFTYTPETWMENRIVVDLDNDVAEFFIDSVSIYSWQWSLGATGDVNELSWGGMDIFAYAFNAQDAEFYVDDVVLTQLTATGIHENNFDSFIQVYPNPTSSQFQLQVNGVPSGEYQIELVDILGNGITNENIQLTGSYNKTYDMSLARGVYFIRITDGVSTANKKVVVN